MKDYVLDFTNPLRYVLMEYESVDGGLTYRYVYGLRRLHTVIYGIPEGVGSVVQWTYRNADGSVSITDSDPNNPDEQRIVKLFHHQNRLGTTDYLTDNISGRITSYVSYDDFGMLTAKAVIRLGQRELDLVTDFTGHFFDPVLGIYYARARMYDAANRRFMAIDPIKDGWNWYAYVNNNPIKYIDPTGLIPVDGRLELNMGSTNLNQRLSSDTKNIIAMQIRLLALGYFANPSMINFGRFDRVTLSAVETFQDSQRLSEMASVTRGVVERDTWIRLSLPFEQPHGIGALGVPTMAADGRTIAINLLDAMIAEMHRALRGNPLHGNRFTRADWNYFMFLFERTYFFRLICPSSDFSWVAFTHDELRNFAASMASGGFLLGPMESIYRWMISETPNQDRVAAERQAARQRDYDMVVLSPLRYVLDPNRTINLRGNHNHYLMGYISRIVYLTQRVANESGGNISGLRSKTAHDYAMSYLIQVAILNLSRAEREAMFDALDISR